MRLAPNGNAQLAAVGLTLDWFHIEAGRELSLRVYQDSKGAQDAGSTTRSLLEFNKPLITY